MNQNSMDGQSNEIELDSNMFDNSGNRNISLIEQARLKAKLGIKQPTINESLVDTGEQISIDTSSKLSKPDEQIYIYRIESLRQWIIVLQIVFLIQVLIRNDIDNV